MRVSKVVVKNYGCFKNRSFQLGPNVNLLTASNGAGKTTLCSAIVWGLWGKHLREVDLVPGASVRLEFGSTITRSVNGRGETVELTGQPTMNKTRFSEVMLPVLGEYGAWSKSLWVTGSNVANFSQGSPRDRFQYLSKIVGAAQFDVYLDKLKARYTETKNKALFQKVHLESGTAALAREWSEMVRRRVRDVVNYARFLRQSPVDTASLAAQKSSLEDQVEEAKQLLHDYEQQRDDYRKALRLNCPTCNQYYLTEEQKLTDADLANQVRKQNGELARLTSDLRLAQSKLDRALHDAANLTSFQQDVEADEQMLLEDLEEFYERQKIHTDKVESAAQETDESADIGILGQCVKQAKHDYLASAANAITKTTNHYLSVIGTDYVVSIDYIDEALVVNLHQGPVKTYSKLSSGQKRRVDICLCLAMSQLAATVGTVPKTAPLIIDEAFDTLDNAGVEALISLACEIAKERQVILVSHADPSAPLGPQVSRISL